MFRKLFFYFVISLTVYACTPKPAAELVLINGKIVTVDKDFSVAEAVAIRGNEILATGTSKTILKMSDENTKTIDLQGKTVIPGLTDGHLHPEMASVSELDQEIPDIHTLTELLDWIKGQAQLKKKGEWIIHPKFFATRLIELKAPTLAELDDAAPANPVFLNGSYGGVINTAAMKISGINETTGHPGILKDHITGKPNGIIRGSAFGLLRFPEEKALTRDEELDALVRMIRRYNAIGLTSLGVGMGDSSNYATYRLLKEQGRLTARIFMNYELGLRSGITAGSVNQKLNSIPYVTGDGDEWVRIGALKVLLDGGILTGTAYMREPWGDKAAEIFGITDAAYRGVINYSREDLLVIVTAANERNWKFTAHITGGGGVDLLLSVFEEVNNQKPIRDRRSSIIHGNFFTPEAIKKMSDLGIFADLQPAWFYKDADAMLQILGEERMKSFHPYKSMVDAGVMINAGSDHMVKWDAGTSINPYNPFLAMWSMVTHKTERGTVIIPSEVISREDALRAYTINNAYASFEENIKGSIEQGKLADLVILSDDILTCPEDQIKKITPELTMVDGRIVYYSGKGITLPEGMAAGKY